MKKAINRLILITLGFIMLMGCTTPAPPTAALSTNTSQPLATTPAPSTTTAPSATMPAPTSTLAPTATEAMPYITSMPMASYTATSIPTYVIGHITPTPTPYAGTPKPNITEYACYQTLQLPPIGASYHIRDEFDAHWQIVNRELDDWNVSETKIYYANGAPLHTKVDSIPLPHVVKSGKAVDLIVDMTVPAEPGFYSTSWVVANRNRVVCILTVSINAY